MTEEEKQLFRNKKYNPQKLTDYGFTPTQAGYAFGSSILDGQMELHVEIGTEIHTRVLDRESGEEYMVYRMKEASGAFVGQVREECLQKLQEIADACFEEDVFKSPQACALLSVAREEYGTRPEFLWKKYPEYAVLRREDSKKWYAVLMRISRRKLGMDRDEMVEVVNLHMDMRDGGLVDGVRFFKAYHMNANWCTICLDETVNTENILELMAISYDLAGKKKKNGLDTHFTQSKIDEPAVSVRSGWLLI